MEQALTELSADNTETRLRGVRRLGVTGGAEAVAARIRTLDDPEADVASRAALMLGETEAPEGLPVLLERLSSHTSGEVRASCAMALESYGDACPLEALLAALRDPEEDVVATAAHVLGWRGDRAAVEPLLSLLDDPRRNVRYFTCSALGTLEVRDRRLTSALEGLLRTPEKLEWFQSLDWIESALEEADAAADAPGAAEPSEEEVLAKAERALREGSPDERRKAAHALRQFDGETGVPALIQALEDPDVQVRSTAALVLVARGAFAALPGLIRHLLHDGAHHVRRICAAFLDRFPALEVVGPLRQACGDADWGVRLAAYVALGNLGDPRAIPELIQALDDPVWNNRINASWTLVKLGAADPRLVVALEQLARDPEAVEWDLQADEMNQMMAKLPPEEGEPESQPSPRVRQLLAEARRLMAEGPLRPGLARGSLGAGEE